MATVQDNKALVRRVFEEAWNQRDFSVLDEAYAPDVVHHNPSNPEDLRGVEAVKRHVRDATEAFPDIRFSLGDLVAEDDTVIAHWTLSGTHEQAFGGIPATGNRVEIEGFILSRFAEGRIVEEWSLRDTLGMLQQLGVIELPAE